MGSPTDIVTPFNTRDGGGNLAKSVPGTNFYATEDDPEHVNPRAAVEVKFLQPGAEKTSEIGNVPVDQINTRDDQPFVEGSATAEAERLAAESNPDPDNPVDGDQRTNDLGEPEVYSDGAWHPIEGGVYDQAAGIGDPSNDATPPGERVPDPERQESQNNTGPSRLESATDLALPEGWEESDRDVLVELGNARGLDLPGNIAKLKAVAALKKWEKDQG